MGYYTLYYFGCFNSIPNPAFLSKLPQIWQDKTLNCDDVLDLRGMYLLILHSEEIKFT